MGEVVAAEGRFLEWYLAGRRGGKDGMNVDEGCIIIDKENSRTGGSDGIEANEMNQIKAYQHQQTNKTPSWNTYLPIFSCKPSPFSLSLSYLSIQFCLMKMTNGEGGGKKHIGGLSCIFFPSPQKMGMGGHSPWTILRGFFHNTCMI